MSFKFFSSHNTAKESRHSINDIECENNEIKELITHWAQNEGWNYENFADFMRLIGIQTPIYLSNFNKWNHSFRCISADEKELKVSLFYSSGFDWCSEIEIDYGNEKLRFQINSTIKKRNVLPEVKLISYTVYKNGENYSISKDGYWKYSSNDGIEMVSKGDKISIEFSKKLIKDINLNELIKNVMSQIDDITEYVE